MSVILKEKELYYTLIESIKNNDKLLKSLDYNQYFNYRFNLDKNYFKNKMTLEEYKKYFVGIFFNHIYKGNCFSYISQYGVDNIQNNYLTLDEYNESKIKIIYDNKELLEELESLNYNLFDNNGYTYLDKYMLEFLEYIMSKLKDILTRDY